jgi:hypothetical protein
VNSDDMPSIGVFALVSGLSLNALRHYDGAHLRELDHGSRRYRGRWLHVRLAAFEIGDRNVEITFVVLVG